MQSDPHKTCPYRNLPAEAYWRQSVAECNPDALNPASKPSFSIGVNDGIATAGSCFAQHIAKHLDKSGYRYLVTEQPHALMSSAIAEKRQYGVFSARYGNIYTTRQLRQTLDRAYGLLQPMEHVWRHEDGIVDPYRPFIQPGGFATMAEFEDDQDRHFAAIRALIEECDIFVFTLGLTEAWLSRDEGMVFPICPGCGAGEHDPKKYVFKNFSASEVRTDLEAALSFIREKNPSVKFVLTVSPVPLIATAADRHVLTSTTYSKSVLRVAAEEVSSTTANCDYFPSYEIITGSYSRGAYFDEDLRSVKAEGVAHVMRCFGETYLGNEPKAPRKIDRKPEKSISENLNDILCDEEELIR